MSVLVSGSDTSFFSLNSHDLNDISDIDKKRKANKRIISDPKKLFALIYLAKNFTNTLIIILSFFILNNIFDFSSSIIIQFIFQVIIITFILVLHLKLLQNFMSKNAVSFSIYTYSLVKFLYLIFSPISSFVINSSSFIDERLKQKSLDISLEELSQALDFSRGEDKLKEEKRF